MVHELKHSVDVEFDSGKVAWKLSRSDGLGRGFAPCDFENEGGSKS